MIFIVIIVIISCCSNVKCDHLNLHEGSPCSWKGIDGQCVSVFRCVSSLLDAESKEYAPICSFHNKVPIVCCTDCQLVNDTRTIILDETFGFIYKTGPKAKDKCLEYLHQHHYPCKSLRRTELERRYQPDTNCFNITEKIQYAYASIGGRDAVREEFPHMALLGYGDNATSADWLCGGSVISERFILTAAHCLSSPAVGNVKFVALGILKRSDPQHLWQRYNVKRSIPHPQYKPPSKYHDIALLETDKQITFTDSVKPACLHVEGLPSANANALGWGALGPRQMLADVLQSVDVTKFSEEECAGFYPPHRHLKQGYDHKTQMCYGDPEMPKDTCEGDSGGPLQSKLFGYYYFCMYTILGVTSYGRQCGSTTSSGMYTRVYHYVPWIESIVWP